MAKLFYDLFADNNMLGYLMEYESTQILCRYLAIGFSVAVFILVCWGLLEIIKLIGRL